MMAGTPHARRREWAALRGHVNMSECPERISRFLGVRYDVRVEGKHTIILSATQNEYVDAVVSKNDAAAPFPATRRMTPAVKRSARWDDPGERAKDCRTHIGALMYIVRATRPDATYAVNRLARKVTCWSKSDDADLAHIMGYLKETAGCSLEMEVDVRDRKSEVWLEIWVDADHAGDDDRRSTGGWVLLLRRAHGT